MSGITDEVVLKAASAFQAGVDPFPPQHYMRAMRRALEAIAGEFASAIRKQAFAEARAAVDSLPGTPEITGNERAYDRGYIVGIDDARDEIRVALREIGDAS